MPKQNVKTQVKAPVPTPDFDREWEETYFRDWMAYCQRAAYRQPQIMVNIGSAEDLLQDMWINVWKKSVEAKWGSYAAKSIDPNLKAWSNFLRRNYIIDLVRKAETRPMKFRRSQESIDAPIESGDGGVTTQHDMLGALDRAFDMVESDTQIQDLLTKITDPVLRQTIQIMVENHEPPEELWARIRRETGHSRGFLQGKMRANQPLLDFMKSVLNKESKRRPAALVASDNLFD